MEMSCHYPVIPAEARADGVDVCPKQLVMELCWNAFAH